MSTNHESENRQFLRYEVLDYAVITPVGGAESVNAIIVDLGLGGLQLRSKQLLPVGAACTLQVGRLEDEPLVFHGEVRHSRLIGDTTLVSTGIRFTPKGHEERLAVAAFVQTIFRRQCDLLVI